MNIEERINFYLNEEDDDKKKKNNKISWDDVKEAIIETAKDVFDDDYDEDKLNVEGIIKAVKKEKPEDTEDAIAIAQNMVRAE